MKCDRVCVPAKVLQGLEAIRLSGKTNMLDIPTVVNLALEIGFSRTAMWLSQHRDMYAQGVIFGFEPINCSESSECEAIDRNAANERSDQQCADK